MKTSGNEIKWGDEEGFFSYTLEQRPYWSVTPYPCPTIGQIWNSAGSVLLEVY